MADVKRTLSALQALYADNTTGDISPQDLRDGFKSVVGNYYTSATAGSITYLSANDIYVNVNTSAGTRYVVLPSVSGSDGTGDTFNGKYYLISNYAPTNTSAVQYSVIVSANEYINTSRSYIIPPNKSALIASNGTNWNTIEKYNENTVGKYNKSTKTGLIIPFYVYPSSVLTNIDYNRLISLKCKYQDVPVMVIMNPNSGPGTVVDSSYATAIKRMQHAGITVVGYVYTSYSARDTSAVKADLDNWISLYPEVEGFFFDETSSTFSTSAVAYYRDIGNHAKNNRNFLVANVGVPFNSGLIYGDVFDVVVGWENDNIPTTDQILESSTTGASTFSLYRRAILLHTMSSWNPSLFRKLSKKFGWVFFQDAVNTWHPLSPYVEDMMIELSKSTEPFDFTPNYYENNLLIPFNVQTSAITSASYLPIINARQKYPGVGITVIANPSDGIILSADTYGTHPVSGYTNLIDNLRGLGCRVLGYVSNRFGGNKFPGFTSSTTYSSNARYQITSASTFTKTYADSWYSYYPNIDGIYVDEVWNGLSGTNFQDNLYNEVDYYRDITGYIKNYYNPEIVIANCSGDTNVDYWTYNIADVFVLNITSGSPSENILNGTSSSASHQYIDRRRKAFIVNNQSSLNMKTILSAYKYASYFYSTDDSTGLYRGVSNHLLEQANVLSNSYTSGSNILENAELRFYDYDNTHYVGLKSSTSGLSANTTFTLPISDGTSGQFLVTDGNKNLSWSDYPNLLKGSQSTMDMAMAASNAEYTNTIPVYFYYVPYHNCIVSSVTLISTSHTTQSTYNFGFHNWAISGTINKYSAGTGSVTVTGQGKYTFPLDTPIVLSAGVEYFVGFVKLSGSSTLISRASTPSNTGLAFTGTSGISALPSSQSSRVNVVTTLPYFEFR